MKNATVKFGELNAGDTFIFEGHEFFKTRDFYIYGKLKNAFCSASAKMVNFDNDEEVIVEVPLTFADLALCDRFVHGKHSYVKVADYEAVCAYTGGAWAFYGDEEVIKLCHPK